MNETLLEKAKAAHVIKLDKIRADTTVVPANIAYPTDSGLLAKGVAKLTKSVGALKALGLARRTRFRDRTRSVRRRAHQIAAWLRRRSGEAKDEVLALTGELATLAEAALKDAQVVATNARRSLRRAGEGASGRARALVTDLERTIEVLEKVVAQTRTRLTGGVPDGASRVVSLHDTDARPIAKGRLGRPVEFGFKAQVADNTDGIVLDHQVEMGNPPDAPMLAPAIARITKRFSRAPTSVTADRGYGEAKVEEELHSIGVSHVAIPARGVPGPSAKNSSPRDVSESSSSGAPDPRDASRISSTAGVGDALSSTGSTERAPGAGGVCSPTTPPRSRCSSRNETFADPTNPPLVDRADHRQQRKPPPPDPPSHSLWSRPEAGNGRRAGRK